MLDTLFTRLTAARRAFANPGRYSPPLTASVTVDVDEDDLREIIADELSDDGGGASDPPGEDVVSGVVDIDTAAELSDRIKAEVPAVPDDALIQRITLDAVHDVRVYFNHPPGKTD